MLSLLLPALMVARGAHLLADLIAHSLPRWRRTRQRFSSGFQLDFAARKYRQSSMWLLDFEMGGSVAEIVDAVLLTGWLWFNRQLFPPHGLVGDHARQQVQLMV